MIETCNENTFSYGLKDKVTEWWKKIEKDFQAVVNRPIPYKSVRRRIELLVEQRKKEIADYQTGDERKEDNWTHAIDAWIETVEIYNLEQENSLRENSVVKIERAISTMKRANMPEIHSKRKGIEDFYEDTEGSEDGGELEETDAALEPDYQSSPDVQERNFLDDDEDLSDGDIRPTKRAKVAMVNVSRPESATPIQEEDASQPPVSKQKLGQRRAAEKQKKMLDKAEKLRKSLNPKKPKRTREARASDTDAPLNAMAQTFSEYIQHLKATLHLPLHLLYQLYKRLLLLPALLFREMLWVRFGICCVN